MPLLSEAKVTSSRQIPRHQVIIVFFCTTRPRRLPRSAPPPRASAGCAERVARRAAMEVSGIEGNFRHTCESVMRVLRGNKDSVMAMLEAFVHDPLINWRLLNTNEGDPEAALAGQADAAGAPRGDFSDTRARGAQVDRQAVTVCSSRFHQGRGKAAHG